MRFVTNCLLALLLAGVGVTGAYAQTHHDMGKSPTPRPIVLSPTFESDVPNGDGTWTFTQVITAGSTPPHYYGPFTTTSTCSGAISGFGYYSYFDQDYGWQHSYPHWSTPSMSIQSATMRIVAWDVDSEPEHGLDGEYDGIHVDGTLLDPGYLQGTNGTWSVTNFDVPVSALLGDGLVNVFMNIDMNHTVCTWATTLDSCVLRVVYRPDSSGNHAPCPPLLTITPGPPRCPRSSDNLVVSITGPVPADPDGDPVTYTYRWFVDIGTGSFLDDEFAGRGDHTGNTVPAADTQPGDIWRVQVTPMDSHGAIGNFATATFNQVDGPTVNAHQSWGYLKALYH